MPKFMPALTSLRASPALASVALAAMGLAGAACTPVAQPGPQARRTPIQTFAPATMQPVSGENDNASTKVNLPSAPLNTPLCGTHLQAQAQMGAQLFQGSLASGNACTANACFQPLTGTYIAQNNDPTVCR
ncbi:hypothetical protein [Oecophyllibacter saccharovorans]|uniref:hypothetical protein n=1 Tax=Oecophyllibacter saccharovorans TaxID=2558360 RepID=UPI001E293116|nr:hypothetical protein [Oecophyllibacter saccharovorans]